MAKIANKGVGETGTVTVSGHTDNVPLMFGGTLEIIGILLLLGA